MPDHNDEFQYIQAKRDPNCNLIVPVVKTPQFPGVNPGMSIEAVRKVIRNQKRVKGFQFDLSAGADNSFPVNLSGTARLFLGYALEPLPDFVPGDVPLSITITINNEIVVEKVFPSFFGSTFMDDEYYFIPRPLSGQDVITIQFNAPSDFTLFMAVYYI